MINGIHYHKIRTPINTINAVGAGGFNWGTMIELWGGPKCLHGDTLIKCLDGTSKLIKELEGSEEFWVYSYDLARNQIVPGKARFANKKLSNKLIKITLDNGKRRYGKSIYNQKASQPVICTDDHKWMMFDGSYVEAKNLKIGDSLMAMYSKYRDSEEIQATSYGSSREDYDSVPYMVAFHYLSREERKFLPKNIEIHHTNNNHNDNRPLNLLITNKSEHAKLHGIENISKKGMWEGHRIWKNTEEGLAWKGKSRQLCIKRNTSDNPPRKGNNHKIINIEYLDIEEYVYDISVENYNNFCIDLGNNTGVFVHNSGKSTTAYQTAEMFLEDYGNKARLIILDAEKSADDLRLRRVFNISPGIRYGTDTKSEVIENGDSRVAIGPAITVEQAFSVFSKYVSSFKDKDVYILGIWDSITASGVQAEWNAMQDAISKDRQAIEFAAGMMAKPRVLGQHLNKILGLMWDNKNTSLILINQARMEIGRYTSGEGSTGGYAKDHNIHYSIYFSGGKKIGQNEYFKEGTNSVIRVDKSKFMPSVSGVNIFIYDTLGGKLSPDEELLTIAGALDIINSGSGWYSLKDKLISNKSYRWADALKDKEFLSEAYSELIKYFRSKFQLVNWEYEEIESKMPKAGEISE